MHGYLLSSNGLNKNINPKQIIALLMKLLIFKLLSPICA